eukprot:142033-Prorocentrum_lima.AAC.1
MVHKTKARCFCPWNSRLVAACERECRVTYSAFMLATAKQMGDELRWATKRRPIAEKIGQDKDPACHTSCNLDGESV